MSVFALNPTLYLCQGSRDLRIVHRTLTIERLLQEQDGVCAIAGRTMPRWAIGSCRVSIDFDVWMG
jgi:hypothetical protein